jgi:hypothetical protein
MCTHVDRALEFLAVKVAQFAWVREQEEVPPAPVSAHRQSAHTKKKFIKI